MNLVRPVVAATAAFALVTLTACGASEPSASPKDATSTPIIQDVTPLATDEPAEQTADLPAERVVPDECSTLTLDAGVKYTGDELAPCVAKALASYGSGRMDMAGSTQEGTASFTYTPDYNFQVVGSSDGSPISLIFADSVMWVDTGNGWIEGDPQSTDPQEQMAGMVGQLYRAFSDPSLTRDLVEAADSWTADPERELRALPTGGDVSAVRITNDEPFEWLGFKVDEYIFWYGDDWVPVGDQATTSFGDLGSETVTQVFYDLGSDIEIVAPTP